MVCAGITFDVRTELVVLERGNHLLWMTLFLYVIIIPEFLKISPFSHICGKALQRLY
jgi:hypothetical protein